MKILKILAIAVVTLFIGAFLYVGFAEVSVSQKDVVKEIPHDHFVKP